MFDDAVSVNVMKECPIRQKVGKNYTGTEFTATKSGRQCQDWTKQAWVESRRLLIEKK